MGKQAGNRDVFIPNYRLLPEYELDDALHDVVLAYEYLVFVRKVLPKNIVLLGVSSGGGLVSRLMQTISEQHRGEFDKTYGLARYQPDAPFSPDSICASRAAGVLDDRSSLMPSGAVLMCPFVDYTEPKGSFVEYVSHDLIVNQVRCIRLCINIEERQYHIVDRPLFFI
jgi:acetyl esterase/lipase